MTLDLGIAAYRVVELTCDVETERLNKTTDQENKAVATYETQILSPVKSEVVSKDDRDVELTCGVETEQNYGPRKQSGGHIRDTNENERALELATEVQTDAQVQPENLEGTSKENRAAVDTTETIILLTPGASASISDAHEDERIDDLSTGNPEQTDLRVNTEPFETPEKMEDLLVNNPEEQIAAFITNDGELVIVVPAGPTGLQNGAERLEEIATASVSPRQATSKKGKKKKGKRRRN